MVIVAVAMVMTPAVYYRAWRGHATAGMVQLSGKMIRGALVPLAFGLALDMFTVFDAVTSHLAASVVVSLAVFALLCGLWFLLPARGPGRDARRGEQLHR